ncbi:MAG: threonylcarbamoyl-AMP synthase, partial [Syntrophomonadaceae bacterium]|nr:threonylcarbamoyl-AMP synthase [Syntrophomonadaceae bacterium]
RKRPSYKSKKGVNILDTLYLKVDALKPEIEQINKAVALLKKGELVAFPTETVYGVGATIFNPDSVQEIYKVKNRPFNNPLLVHISNIEQVQIVSVNIPLLAYKLMEKFWPGPLSLILPASDKVPSIVTAGQKNVGLRMPSHKVSIELINRSGPLAATSANLSNRPSPTTAKHVQDDLDGKIAAIIDAGPTGVGLESTIIDFTCKVPKVLRLGGMALEEIEETISMKLEYTEKSNQSAYQGNTKILLSNDGESFILQVLELINSEKKVGVVYNNHTPKQTIKNVAKEYYLNINNPGADFFALLRDAETEKLDVLVFAPFPKDLTNINKALLDRIHKAVNTNYHS